MEKRTEEIFENTMCVSRTKTDRMLLILLFAQWAFAIGLALVLSPYAWDGKTKSIHLHLELAVFLGGFINALPIFFIITRPGWWGTRHVVAIAQMLWSGLFIHLSGGRIETHFHVFGSLAFLAFYRDWKLLITATAVVASDHLVRQIFWPESVYGTLNPEWWRFFEHAAWVTFENIVLYFGCVRGVSENRGLAVREAELEQMNNQVEAKVAERTEELNASREQFRALVETANTVPWEMNADSGEFLYVGPQVKKIFGYSPDAWCVPGFHGAFVHASDVQKVKVAFENGLKNGNDFELEYRIDGLGKDVMEVRNVVTVTKGKSGNTVFRGLMFDITEKKKLENELSQSQKLESVGRLAAGVAHEINTPIQFISDSVHFVKESIESLDAYVRKTRELVEGAEPRRADLLGGFEKESDAADLPYILENIPKAVNRSLEGLERVAKIVHSMKEFAHPDTQAMDFCDLNRGIKSTLEIARNEYKYVADVDLDLGELPPVHCHPGEINQVVLNLVVNAAHAIGDLTEKSGGRGRITIKSVEDKGGALISITDTGPGIPDAIKDKVFDQFFTTKVVGKGTGLGLNIARAAVIKHGGTLTFESTAGVGTTFFIWLPARTAETSGLRAGVLT